MEEQTDYIYTVEQALLAGLITGCASDRAVVSMMLSREDFYCEVNGRLYAAIQLYGLDDQAQEGLGLELARMFEYCGDRQAVHALVDLAMVDYPPSGCQLGLVKLALEIHDASIYRDDVRLHEQAIDRWIAEECERADCSNPDDEVEW